MLVVESDHEAVCERNGGIESTIESSVITVVIVVAHLP